MSPARRKKSASRRGVVHGRFQGDLHPALDRINRSYAIDCRLWREDIQGSIAHAEMLGAVGILRAAQVRRIVKGLGQIADEFAEGSFKDVPGDEDIHMAVERRLTELIGEDGKRLHTGRSRNDQVATDLKLYLRSMTLRVRERIEDLQRALLALAERDGPAILPFYTHLQRAQPMLLGHVLLAYIEMLEQDRLELDRDPTTCPLGAAAGAGTTHAIEPRLTAKALGFKRPVTNSLLEVSSRRDAAMATAALASLAVTLSRLGGEWVLWTSREFAFARLDDAVSTGSSIMPQKRNPDGAELLRSAATRVIGASQRLFEVQRGLPLGYHKDLQEDKAAVFEADDTIMQMLDVAIAMAEHICFDTERMQAAVTDPEGFLLATELADWLVQKGCPFREAHDAIGELVRLAESRGCGLEDLSLSDLRSAHRAFTEEAQERLDPERALRARKAVGAPSPAGVNNQLRRWSRRLGSA